MLMKVTTTATAATECVILFLMDVFLPNCDSCFGGGNITNIDPEEGQITTLDEYRRGWEMW